MIDAGNRKKEKCDLQSFRRGVSAVAIALVHKEVGNQFD
jgi:hypothetical protein